MAARGPLYQFSGYERAKMNRNNVVEFDDNYLDLFLDPSMLKQMHETYRWLDEDGFYRGFAYTFASYHVGQPAICVGIKPSGSNTAYKIVVPPSFDVIVVQ